MLLPVPFLVLGLVIVAIVKIKVCRLEIYDESLDQVILLYSIANASHFVFPQLYAWENSRWWW